MDYLFETEHLKIRKFRIEEPYALAVELKGTGKLIGDTGVNEVKGKANEVEIGYVFAKEEFGAEDAPYGKGMMIYKKEC